MAAPDLSQHQVRALADAAWNAHGAEALQLVSEATARAQAEHRDWTPVQAFHAGLLSLQPRHHTFAGTVAPNPLLGKGIRDDRA